MNSPALKPGSCLRDGTYRIVRTLGQGGFGITYLAEQVMLEGEVAVKEFFMKDCCEREGETSRMSVPTQNNREVVEKFKGKFIREAQMIFGLKHPNIVHVMDVFEENGTAYYVMDNLPGGSLADKVKAQGRLSEAEACRYIRQIGSALDYIHKKNLVHLDVKPSNILLNAKGEAVLIDFGISKHYDSSGEQTSSTPVGISKGYAPLEQGRDGDVSQFSGTTDIYALGATLYYLVTGCVPPEAAIVNEDGLERLAGVSDEIWLAIEKAMQPRRKDRPQNVPAFLDMLGEPEEETPVIVEVEDEEGSPAPVEEPVPAEEPVGPSVAEEQADAAPAAEAPADTEEAAAKPASKKRKLWIGVAALGCAVVIGIIVILGGRGKAERFPFVESYGGYEFVDMGLSVKWASCNMGASSPEEYGDYYAWGEVETKKKYNWETYIWKKGGGKVNIQLLKYNTNVVSGPIDSKKRLEPSDDAAHKVWGGSWRIPTYDEWKELLDNCSAVPSTVNGVQGLSISSKKNGNRIFLPAAGYFYGKNPGKGETMGMYWSSSLFTKDSKYASRFYFDSNNVVDNEKADLRCIGHSIRPVSP